jgi:hypothetical protein
MQVGGRLPSTSSLIRGAYIKAYNDVYLLMMAFWTFGLGQKNKYNLMHFQQKKNHLLWNGGPWRVLSLLIAKRFASLASQHIQQLYMLM